MTDMQTHHDARTFDDGYTTFEGAGRNQKLAIVDAELARARNAHPQEDA